MNSLILILAVVIAFSFGFWACLMLTPRIAEVDALTREASRLLREAYAAVPAESALAIQVATWLSWYEIATFVDRPGDADMHR